MDAAPTARPPRRRHAPHCSSVAIDGRMVEPRTRQCADTMPTSASRHHGHRYRSTARADRWPDGRRRAREAAPRLTGRSEQRLKCRRLDLAALRAAWRNPEALGQAQQGSRSLAHHYVSTSTPSLFTCPPREIVGDGADSLPPAREGRLPAPCTRSLCNQQTKGGERFVVRFAPATMANRQRRMRRQSSTQASRTRETWSVPRRVSSRSDWPMGLHGTPWSG